MKLFKGIIIDNLTEEELKMLHEMTQTEIASIEEEKARKRALKKSYSLKDVPSTFKVNQSRLGFYTLEWFQKEQQETMSKDIFEKLLKQSTDETKPKKEDIYACPECGEHYLRVGRFGDSWVDKYAVTCDSCNFTMKKMETSQWDAWATFHKWLVKNGYLSKDIKFQWT